jgi:SOS-response transcriptional repressor LexA
MTRSPLEAYPGTREVLEFLARFQARYAYPPTVREIAQALPQIKLSGVHRRLAWLQREGYLAPRRSYRQPWLIVPGGPAGEEETC